MDVGLRIRQYFKTAIGEEIGERDDIFELGIVDSLFAIQLVTFVEREFAMTVERQDLDIKNFVSISAVTDFVRRKLGKTAVLGAGS